MELLKRGLLWEGTVSERNVVDSMVRKDRQRVGDGGLLATLGSASRHKEAGGFTNQTTACPQGTSAVPERLPLRREGTIASWHTEEVGVVLGKSVDGGNGIVRLGGSVDRGEDRFGEGLRDLEDGGLASSGLDAGLDGFSEGRDVAVGSVDDDSDAGSHCGKGYWSVRRIEGWY